MSADSPQSSPTDDPPRRKRGRWQFGLSTLLLVVTACAVASWWYAQESWEAFRERFTERVEKLGGYVEWRRLGPGGGTDRPTRISFRYWGRTVEPTKTALTDEQLRRLRRDLSRLGPFSLNIGGTSNARGKITDAGLEHLEGLRGLECLCLRYSDITDAGLEHVSRIKGLQFVDVRDTEVTGEAIRGISRPGLVICSEAWQDLSEISPARWKPPAGTHMANESPGGLAAAHHSLCFQARATGELATVDIPRSESLGHVRSVFLSPNDVVVTLHDSISDSGAQVARIDLGSSPAKVVWEKFAQPLGVDHSKYRHSVQVFVHDDRCVVVSDGAETFVEIRDLATGRLLGRWVY